MSETAIRAEKSTRKDRPSSAESPLFEMPKMEIPEPMRDAATKWISQGKKAFEEMNGAFESAYSTATKGAMDCGAKVSEATRTNTVVAFEVAHDLMTAKSLPEMMEISTAGARKQFEALAVQNQELWSLTQQLVTETIKPIAGGLPNVFSPGVSS